MELTLFCGPWNNIKKVYESVDAFLKENTFERYVNDFITEYHNGKLHFTMGATERKYIIDFVHKHCEEPRYSNFSEGDFAFYEHIFNGLCLDAIDSLLRERGLYN